MTFRPDPKPKRERLKRTSKAWRTRVLEVFTRDGYRCKWCRNIFPFEYLSPCHIKSTGAGGGDEAENIDTGCKECHGKQHNGDFFK